MNFFKKKKMSEGGLVTRGTFGAYSPRDYFDRAAQAALRAAVEKVEQVDTEIVAWRGWQVVGEDRDDVVLGSINGTRWESPTLVAHERPAPGSDDGIYALKQFPAPREHSYTSYFCHGAFGQVALSGLVVEGEYGYRAERATIRSVWLTKPELLPMSDQCCAWEIAGLLSQRYDTDVDLVGRRWREWFKDVEVANQMSRFRFV
jgi:hypothetical protein